MSNADVEFLGGSETGGFVFSAHFSDTGLILSYELGPFNTGGPETRVDVASQAFLFTSTDWGINGLTREPGGTLPISSFDFSNDGLSILVPAIRVPGETEVFLSTSFSVEPLPAQLAGDTNSDGFVDVTDLNNVLNNFATGELGGAPVIGDAYPFDGVVNLGDLNLVRNHFGESLSTTTAVPEPTTVVLALASVFVVLTRHRNREPASLFAGSAKRKSPSCGGFTPTVEKRQFANTLRSHRSKYRTEPS